MICGATGRYREHIPHVFKIVGVKEGVDQAAALSMLIMPKGTIFICDTHVNPGPSAEQIAGFTFSGEHRSPFRYRTQSGCFIALKFWFLAKRER